MTIKDYEVSQLANFFEQCDADGVSNAEKIGGFSAENVKEASGIIYDENDRLVGIGIHIFNEDVYPIQSSQAFYRGLGLTGSLNTNNFEDCVFMELYRNDLTEVSLKNMPALRILGYRGCKNLHSIDTSECPALQGLDAGICGCDSFDMSKNPELVEFYCDDNRNITSVDISKNPKLKYFYCHKNNIAEFDGMNNPLLRHVDTTENPMIHLKCWAPRPDHEDERGEDEFIELTAGEGGFVGILFKPIYNEKWKETGEWQQKFVASPKDGFEFIAWIDDKTGKTVSTDSTMDVEIGTAAQMTATFKEI